jgi:hypothetical protein
MNGAITVTTTNVSQHRTEIGAWIRTYIKPVLLAINALVLLILIYSTISWMIFEIGTQRLLAKAEQIEKQQPSGPSLSAKRTLLAAESQRPAPRKEKAESRSGGTLSSGTVTALLQAATSGSLLSGEMSATTSTTETLHSGGNGGSAPADNETISEDRSSPGRQAGKRLSPEEEKKKELFAKLERRALFGERKPTAPDPPRIQAIFGDMVLIGDHWLSVGETMSSYTVVQVDVNRVVLEDSEGERHGFGVISGELSAGLLGTSRTSRGSVAQASSRDKGRGKGSPKEKQTKGKKESSREEGKDKSQKKSKGNRDSVTPSSPPDGNPDRPPKAPKSVPGKMSGGGGKSSKGKRR